MSWTKRYLRKRAELARNYGRPAPSWAQNSAATVGRLYR